MGGCGGSSQGDWSGGPGADGGMGSAVKGDRAVPGFMVISGPGNGDAVETKKNREWNRRKADQKVGYQSPTLVFEEPELRFSAGEEGYMEGKLV